MSSRAAEAETVAYTNNQLYHIGGLVSVLSRAAEAETVTYTVQGRTVDVKTHGVYAPFYQQHFIV